MSPLFFMYLLLERYAKEIRRASGDNNNTCHLASRTDSAPMGQRPVTSSPERRRARHAALRNRHALLSSGLLRPAGRHQQLGRPIRYQPDSPPRQQLGRPLQLQSARPLRLPQSSHHQPATAATTRAATAHQSPVTGQSLGIRQAAPPSTRNTGLLTIRPQRCSFRSLRTTPSWGLPISYR